MSFAFNSASGLVVVSVKVTGPLGIAYYKLALDTGATSTIISVDLLAIVGYDPVAAKEHRRITTGSGTALAPVIEVLKLGALGRELSGLPVLAHTVPASAGIDGVLGLDFLRGTVLHVDFQKGAIDLS